MILYITLAAIGGALASGLLGWLSKHDSFSAIKFLPTFIRACVAGAGVAFAGGLIDVYAAEPNAWAAIIPAFLIGAGVDIVGHRVAGSIKS